VFDSFIRTNGVITLHMAQGLDFVKPFINTALACAAGVSLPNLAGFHAEMTSTKRRCIVRLKTKNERKCATKDAVNTEDNDEIYEQTEDDQLDEDELPPRQDLSSPHNQRRWSRKLPTATLLRSPQ
jgi:hypothetical protein